MAFEGFSPPRSPHSLSPSPYYQLLERGFARLGRVTNSLFQTLKNSNYSGKAKSLLIEKRMISSKQKFLLDFYYL